MALDLLFNKIIEGLSEKNFAIAVSGGVDSMVLLNLASRKCKPGVLTVNHGLRLEAEKETELVSEYAHSLGLDCHVLNIQEIRPQGNIQGYARKMRYSLLTEWCKKNCIKYLMTAHHRDDQAETVLMRLERGSGIDGLAAMSSIISLYGVFILRPLLKFSKAELQVYAEANNIPWINDPSNHDSKYKRTLYRQFLQSAGDSEILSKRLYLTSAHMQRVLGAIMHYTRVAYDTCLIFQNYGYVDIKLTKFYCFPEEIAMRVLIYSLMAVGNTQYKPRYKKFSSLFNQVWNKTYANSQTLSGCKIIKHEDIISIVREYSIIDSQEMILNNEKILSWDNRFVVRLRNYTGRDKKLFIEPLGRKQFISDGLKKVYREAAYSLPILRAGEKILAYPDQSNDNVDQHFRDGVVTIDTIEILIKQNMLNLTNIELIGEESLL